MSIELINDCNRRTAPIRDNSFPNSVNGYRTTYPVDVMLRISCKCFEQGSAAVGNTRLVPRPGVYYKSTDGKKHSMGSGKYDISRELGDLFATQPLQTFPILATLPPCKRLM